MRTIQVFVKDSYYTDAIAANLQQFYGDRVQCHTSIADGMKFDLFFLSAKEVLWREISPCRLKMRFGTEGAQVVAVSVLGEYLHQVAGDPLLCVDHTFHKAGLVGGLVFADRQQVGTPEEKLLTILDIVTGCVAA